MDVIQDAHAQILEAFSISAGLDYPGIGPEHSHYHDIKRASYVSVTDEEAIKDSNSCLVWKRSSQPWKRAILLHLQ